MEQVIGIDLGTTNSAVAYWNWAADRAEIIPNRHGNRTTPSVVSYYKGEVLVGDLARSKTAVNPANTIFNAKRVIGRRMNELQESDMRSWPFRIVQAQPHGLPRYAIDDGGTTTLISAEEIAAMVLLELRDAAEAFLGTEVTKCVITVPAYFTAEQRKATLDAGSIAGLDVLSLLAEPTAAALAYGLDEKTVEGEAFRAKAAHGGWHVLVFDLGGGTLDVCVLRLDGRGGFVQRSVTGDSHLGGEDFDSRLSDAVEQRLREEMPAIDFNYKTKRKLRLECERVKRMLSTAAASSIDVDLQGVDVVYDVTRDDFEAACNDLFAACLSVVEEAVTLARLERSNIDEVVLVGGSTRIPRVREMLAQAFPGKRLWAGINPDEAVALGAAVYAATLHIARMDEPALTDTPPPPVALNRSPSPPIPVSPAPRAGSNIAQPTLRHGISAPPPPVGTPTAAEFVSVAATPIGAVRPSGERPVAPIPTKKIIIVKQQLPPPVEMPSVTRPPGPPVTRPPGPPVTRPLGPPVTRPAGPPATAVGPASIVLSNVATHTLGIALAHGDVDPMIPRGTPLPAQHTEKYTTHTANQPQVVIRIVEGDKGSSRTLKHFALKVPPAPAGEPQIRVTFDLSADGLLSVVAVDEATGHRHTVQVNSANMNPAERDAAREKAQTVKLRHRNGTASQQRRSPL